MTKDNMTKEKREALRYVRHGLVCEAPTGKVRKERENLAYNVCYMHPNRGN